MPIISLRENNNFIRENKIVMKFSILKIPKLRNNINLIYIPFHYFQFIINRRGFATKRPRNDDETIKKLYFDFHRSFQSTTEIEKLSRQDTNYSTR